MSDVFLLSPGELYGGVERQIIDLCRDSKSQDRFRMTPVVFHDGPLSAVLRKIDQTPVLLPSRSRYDPGAAGSLAKAISEANIHLVHAHGYRSLVTLAVARLRGKNLPPVVKTEHGLPEATTGLSVTTLKTRLNHRLDCWATRSLDPDVCYVTRDIMDYFSGTHEGLRRHVVYNGIDPLDPSDYERPPELPNNGRTLVMAGRITPVKGIEYAIAALASDVMPKDVQLVLLGTGPLEEDLKTVARRAGILNRVHFLGFQQNVYGFLAHADALLMPSLHEGLPYTLLEAMSLGKPTLASSVGGLREILVDGSTGLLFPPRQPEALAEACRVLLSDKALQSRMGREAARVQRERLTLEVMRNSYNEVYTEALTRTSLRPA